jgi:hypothetical protein
MEDSGATNSVLCLITTQDALIFTSRPLRRAAWGKRADKETVRNTEIHQYQAFAASVKETENCYKLLETVQTSKCEIRSYYHEVRQSACQANSRYYHILHLLIGF